MAKFELDHATDNGVRHFIIHGELPKGLNASWGYPICDSMNRHHCISPEEDDAMGQFVVKALNAHEQLVAALRALRKSVVGLVWQELGSTGDESDWLECQLCGSRSREFTNPPHKSSCPMLLAQNALRAAGEDL